MFFPQKNDLEKKLEENGFSIGKHNLSIIHEIDGRYKNGKELLNGLISSMYDTLNSGVFGFFNKSTEDILRKKLSTLKYEQIENKIIIFSPNRKVDLQIKKTKEKSKNTEEIPENYIPFKKRLGKWGKCIGASALFLIEAYFTKFQNSDSEDHDTSSEIQMEITHPDLDIDFGGTNDLEENVKEKPLVYSGIRGEDPFITFDGETVGNESLGRFIIDRGVVKEIDNQKILFCPRLEGVSVINVTNGSNPKLMFEKETEAPPEICVNDSKMYLADYEAEKIFTFNISNLEDITLEKSKEEDMVISRIVPLKEGLYVGNRIEAALLKYGTLDFIEERENYLKYKNEKIIKITEEENNIKLSLVDEELNVYAESENFEMNYLFGVKSLGENLFSASGFHSDIGRIVILEKEGNSLKIVQEHVSEGHSIEPYLIGKDLLLFNKFSINDYPPSHSKHELWNLSVEGHPHLVYEKQGSIPRFNENGEVWVDNCKILTSNISLPNLDFRNKVSCELKEKDFNQTDLVDLIRAEINKQIKPPKIIENDIKVQFKGIDNEKIKKVKAEIFMEESGQTLDYELKKGNNNFSGEISAVGFNFGMTTLFADGMDEILQRSLYNFRNPKVFLEVTEKRNNFSYLIPTQKRTIKINPGNVFESIEDTTIGHYHCPFDIKITDEKGNVLNKSQNGIKGQYIDSDGNITFFVPKQKEDLNFKLQAYNNGSAIGKLLSTSQGNETSLTKSYFPIKKGEVYNLDGKKIGEIGEIKNTSEGSTDGGKLSLINPLIPISLAGIIYKKRKN